MNVGEHMILKIPKMCTKHLYCVDKQAKGCWLFPTSCCIVHDVTELAGYIELACLFSESSTFIIKSKKRADLSVCSWMPYM